jgi:hypothetical protein
MAEVKSRGFYDPNIRSINPLPLSGEFFDLLQDRIHTCVENILFQGNSNFTLIINAIPRDNSEIQYLERDESPNLIYAGCKKQKQLLEYNLMERWNIYETNFLNDPVYLNAWENLSKATIPHKSSIESAGDYNAIQTGAYSIKDVMEITKLSDYFKKGEGNIYSKEQQWEKTILSPFFDINHTLYISLPLIGFGEFDGMIHVIFEEKLLNNIYTEKNGTTLTYGLTWSLIRAFIIEYDDLFLNWDNVGESMAKATVIYDFIYNTIQSDEAYFLRQTGPGNPRILKELKLQEYYRHHKSYFMKRLDLNEAIPGHIYQQYINQSVISILIDSYAHNVSSHTLSTLSWWYFRRAKQLGNEVTHWDNLLSNLENDPLIDQETLKQFKGQINKRQKRKKGQGTTRENILPKDGGAVINYPGSLARELACLLRFLTEKGAYWGGITRDANVGGEVSSFYNILWNDFINNPFYLGTIAKTEDILKLKVKIILYDDEVESNRDKKMNYHRKTFQPENSRIFAWVDLSQAQTDKNAKSQHEETLSPFINIIEEDFEYLRQRLKEIKIFLPGGVVGKHAFYTMIENEIRNVKHYNREELKVMQEEGLTLAIGIQQCSLHESQAKEIYRMSVWLENPTRLKKGDGHVVLNKWASLDGEIFNKTEESEASIKEKAARGENPRTSSFTPRLGGTFQDKICAAFLFNGHFSWVQRGDTNPDRDRRDDTPRDINYYPWVRPGCSVTNEALEQPGEHIDYKISHNNDPNTPQYLPEVGYLKKIFYVWKGESLYDTGNAALSSWDNPARFGLICTPSEENKLKMRREHGIVRIINDDLSAIAPEKRLAYAYKSWLKTLLGNPDFYALRVRDNGKEVFTLALRNTHNTALEFHYQEPNDEGEETDIDLQLERVLEKDNNKAREWLLDIAHKSDAPAPTEKQEIRYRSHGILRTHFLPLDKEKPAAEDDIKMLELFELLSSKVCIFDDRVHQRLRIDADNAQYADFAREQLKMVVLQENATENKGNLPGWIATLDEPTRRFLKETNFLVMHLSFIERILQQANPNLSPNNASNVGLFLQEQVLSFVGDRDNFFFVVTTGRGRNEWWTSLDKAGNEGFAKITLFRPIETILAAIENSIGIEDDIELKYRIAKILFGS